VEFALCAKAFAANVEKSTVWFGGGGGGLLALLSSWQAASAAVTKEVTANSRPIALKLLMGIPYCAPTGEPGMGVLR
jgi:hypothetical protein